VRHCSPFEDVSTTLTTRREGSKKYLGKGNLSPSTKREPHCGIPSNLSIHWRLDRWWADCWSTRQHRCATVGGALATSEIEWTSVLETHEERRKSCFGQLQRFSLFVGSWAW
jgi:hypothetical protein